MENSNHMLTCPIHAGYWSSLFYAHLLRDNWSLGAIILSLINYTKKDNRTTSWCPQWGAAVSKSFSIRIFLFLFHLMTSLVRHLNLLASSNYIYCVALLNFQPYFCVCTQQLMDEKFYPAVCTGYYKSFTYALECMKHKYSAGIFTWFHQ